MRYVLKCHAGGGEPFPLQEGVQVGPLSVGQEGTWCLCGEGVLPVHAFLYFDGSTLFWQSADPLFPVQANGQPLPQAWTPVPSPATLGMGKVSVSFHAQEEEAHATPVVPPPLPARKRTEAPPPLPVTGVTPPPLPKGGRVAAAPPSLPPRSPALSQKDAQAAGSLLKTVVASSALAASSSSTVLSKGATGSGSLAQRLSRIPLWQKCVGGALPCAAAAVWFWLPAAAPPPASGQPSAPSAPPQRVQSPPPPAVPAVPPSAPEAPASAVSQPPVEVASSSMASGVSPPASVQSVPPLPVPEGKKAEAEKGGEVLTLERQAVDAVAAGDYARAATLYDQLNTVSPHVVFQEAARLARVKASRK